MKKTIFLLSVIILCSFTFNDLPGMEISHKANLLVCCNNENPFKWPGGFGDEMWSYKCYQNGVEVEILIPGRCCAAVWQNNGYQNPVGLPCPNCK